MGMHHGQGAGYLCRIFENMDGATYREILQQHMMATLDYYRLRTGNVILQHDNDPKHKAKETTRILESMRLTENA